jgi:transposase-like protein
MYPYGSGFRNIPIVLIDRFVTPRHLVREIFVDETLLKIDGQDYWLWIAYEPI